MLLANPLNMDAVSEEFLIELVECHCDNILKQKYAEVGVSDFYQFLPNCFLFPLCTLWPCLEVLMFVQFFSTM